MANRIARNTAVLAKIETTYGTDSVPTGAANAMLVSNLSGNPINASNVDRDVLRPFLGASEQLLGTRYSELSFTVELAGAGTVATAPAWGALMRACGLGEVITATFRVDYVPVSTGIESVSIYWYDDGVLHKLTGARGNCSISMKAGGRPELQFKFTGIYSTPTAAANPSVTLTAFKTPQVVVDANSGDVMFGGTHTTTTAPAITGGTAYPSQGLELDLGNSVNFTPMLGGETVDLTQRAVSGKVTLDLTAAQEATFMQVVELGTLQTVGLMHGTVANTTKAGIWLPGVQLINPQKTEVNGKRLISFDMRCTPLVGNDEIRVITSF